MLETTMDGKANLTIECVDCYGRLPSDSAEIVVKHTHCGTSKRVTAETITPVMLRNLDISEGGVYRLVIRPLRHHLTSQLVRLAPGHNALQVVLTLNPAMVSDVRFPSYEDLRTDLRTVLEASETVQDHAGRSGAALYEALESTHRAGLLNIYCKMASTRFLNQRSVFSYILAFCRFAGDRFLAVVEKELRAQAMENTSKKLFYQVPGDMHLPPFPKAVAIGSYKTYDAFGNLHLTFFRDPVTEVEFVDADVDDAQGIQHLAHLIRHTSANGATHPYDIHQILLHHQKLDPGYRLQV